MLRRRERLLLSLLAASGCAGLLHPQIALRHGRPQPAARPARIQQLPKRVLLSRNARMVAPGISPVGEMPQVLYSALLPAVAVVSSCVAGMIPTGYNSFIKRQPDGRSPKLTRRVFTGCLLGAVVSMWIFSGTYGFLSAFA